MVPRFARLGKPGRMRERGNWKLSGLSAVWNIGFAARRLNPEFGNTTLEKGRRIAGFPI